MKKTSDFIEIAKGLTNIAQLGLSVVVPVVLCAFLGVFLRNRFGVPEFIVVLLTLLGIAAGISSAVSFAKSYLRKAKKEAQELAKQTGYHIPDDKAENDKINKSKGR